MTYAQKAARALERNGIDAAVVKAPQSIAGSGCKYCVKIREGQLSRALVILKNAGQQPVQLFIRLESGAFDEVPI